MTNVKSKSDYIFKSERLGFRVWNHSDLTQLAKLNSDVEVMEHFPKTLTKKESATMMDRFQSQFDKYGYTYFATESLKNKEWIGFIGLAFQEYKSAYTPAVDIGWRLKKMPGEMGTQAKVLKNVWNLHLRS